MISVSTISLHNVGLNRGSVLALHLLMESQSLVGQYLRINSIFRWARKGGKDLGTPKVPTPKTKPIVRCTPVTLCHIDG